MVVWNRIAIIQFNVTSAKFVPKICRNSINLCARLGNYEFWQSCLRSVCGSTSLSGYTFLKIFTKACLSAKSEPQSFQKLVKVKFLAPFTRRFYNVNVNNLHFTFEGENKYNGFVCSSWTIRYYGKPILLFNMLLIFLHTNIFLCLSGHYQNCETTFCHEQPSCLVFSCCLVIGNTLTTRLLLICNIHNKKAKKKIKMRVKSNIFLES